MQRKLFCKAFPFQNLFENQVDEELYLKAYLVEFIQKRKILLLGYLKFQGFDASLTLSHRNP